MEELMSFKIKRDGKDFGITVRIEPDTYNQVLNIQVEIIDDVSTFVNIEVNVQSGSFNITGMQALSSTTSCLAVCGIGAILKHLITCFSTDLNKYKKCLKKKGLDLLSEAVACALGCATAGTP
jgi:hypothetical protein